MKNKKKRKLNPYKKGYYSTLLLLALCLFLLFLTLLFIKQPSLVQKLQHRLYQGNDVRVEWHEEELEARLDKTRSFRIADIVEGLVEDIEYTPSLLLINKEHPLPADFTASVIFDDYTKITFHPLLSDPFYELSQAIQDRFEEVLYISSAYRSTEEQAALFEEAPESAQAPYSSEHEAGLALDVLVFEHAGKNFINHPVGRWVNDHAFRYGFIIRYPFGREDITGIPFEPWHLRFVGNPHATIMKARGLVLEEYIAHLRPGTLYLVDDFFIYRTPAETCHLPYHAYDVKISPDNLGNYILWGKIK